MSFEHAGRRPKAEITHALVAGGAANETVPGIYESARRAAADRMERILGRASKRLLKRSVPTSLAAVTSGTDWTTWHFVALSLGWPLENETTALPSSASTAASASTAGPQPSAATNSSPLTPS
ncbi:hypothetical protein ACVWYS_002020 [Arthrobacter sp. TE12231]